MPIIFLPNLQSVPEEAPIYIWLLVAKLPKFTNLAISWALAGPLAETVNFPLVPVVCSKLAFCITSAVDKLDVGLVWFIWPLPVPESNVVPRPWHTKDGVFASVSFQAPCGFISTTVTGSLSAL